MEGQGAITEADLKVIITAIIIGTIARVITLKEDYRQYPSYPNGYLINLVTGFIAASLGAVALPALLNKNFTAVTFLSLGIQQFRRVRQMEKDSLEALEETEYTYRGNAYIDGIAKTFEARNYISLVVALITSVAIKVASALTSFNEWIVIAIGVAVGILTLYYLIRMSKGKTVGDIAEVSEGKVEVKGSELFVDGMYVSNLIGSERGQKLVQEEGIAAVIYPREEHFRINLSNFGQRQAILFEATRALGVKRYHFTRKDFEEGRVVTALVPIKNDIDALIESVKKCPLLESTKKSHAIMKTNMKGRE